MMCFSISTAHAATQDRNWFYTGGNFTAHHLVPQMPYAAEAERLSAPEKLELREYLDYEMDREPCQNYRVPPQPFVTNWCNRGGTVKGVSRRTSTTVTTTETLRPVVAEYVIYFDHDRSNIRESEEATLARVASELRKYQPYEVTIQGFADRSGSADYNLALSQRRAQSVSSALTEVGIPNRVMDKEAYGESHPAVPTPDGVRLEENRRVVIQFRK
jgi:outer membrane protein OmpA-like peptidoglycan-associated protein